MLTRRNFSVRLFWCLVFFLCASTVLCACSRRPKLIETEADPGSLALDARGRYLYVACEGAEKLLAWDLHQRARAGLMEVETGPLRLYLERDNRTLRVLCGEERMLMTVVVPDLKCQDTFALPDSCTALAVRPEKQQFIYSSAETDLLRTYIGKNPLPVIEIGMDPVDLLLQPDTDLLWVANDRAHEVVAVNLEQGQIVTRVPVWPNPRRLLMDPMGDKLLVLCRGQDAQPSESKVHLIDLNYRIAGLTWKAGQDARDFALGTRGSTLFILTADKVIVLSLRTGAVLMEIKTGRDPQAIAISPDGKAAYVSCREEQAVFIHRLDSQALKEK
ncbi:hypothetical protein JW933_08530 [candidate division FCPU426 bacterium]|nr:hypothetical protein [candidate division FCPU426 bacterium]